ncbi:MAG: hypothetical protein ACOYBY_02945 [Dermatophilaceae bacterium]
MVLERLDDLVHGVGAAQPGRHDERLAEAQLDRLRANDLVCPGAEQATVHRVELLDGERLEQLFDVHGISFSKGSAPVRAHASRDASVATSAQKGLPARTG